jgi:hypothetical protein
MPSQLLLEARGFHLDDMTRERLESSDADELETLVVRAVSIETLDELFER